MRVIELVENIVVTTKTVKNNYSLKENEEFSELGEIGQIKQADGTFITPDFIPFVPQTTIEEQILAENQYQTMLLELTTMGGM